MDCLKFYAYSMSGKQSTKTAHRHLKNRKQYIRVHFKFVSTKFMISTIFINIDKYIHIFFRILYLFSLNIFPEYLTWKPNIILKWEEVFQLLNIMYTLKKRPYMQYPNITKCTQNWFTSYYLKGNDVFSLKLSLLIFATSMDTLLTNGHA